MFPAPRRPVSIEFPFLYFEVRGLGRIFRPVVPVSLKTVEGWRVFNFLVDTGSDLMVLPHRFVDILGVDDFDCQRGEAEGLGGHRSKTLEAKIPVRIKDYETTIRVSIVEDNETPLLLGRVGLLDDQFSWIFDAEEKKIIFKEV